MEKRQTRTGPLAVIRNTPKNKQKATLRPTRNKQCGREQKGEDANLFIIRRE
jgi:hypothetical protein